jgi:hypothetical protein
VNPDVGIELVKLLLQVAYADLAVSDDERASLDDVAARVAGDAGLELVRSAIDRKERLLPPNIGMLVPHRAVVLKEVARLGAVDGVHQDELDMVSLIGGMLR